MTQQDRDRFRAISAYVHATHAILALAAVAGPAITLVIASQSPMVTIPAMFCAVLVGLGAAFVVAADFAPGHVLIRWVAPARVRGWLTIAILAAALAVVVLVPDTGGAVTTAAIPMAWALRAVAGGSFWSGIVRLFGATISCGVVTFVVSTVFDQTWEPLTLIVAALLAVGVLGQDSIYTLAIELDDLRTLEAARAIVTERKRFAGDLHDIQGQHLGLITVEAELVSRLIEARDYPAAARHAQQLQSIAIEALEEMHRVVHANREVRLHQEIANAVRVLEAAGIAVTQKIAGIDLLLEDHDRLLGLTVREAITNILKHSRASSCSIETRHDFQGGCSCIELVVIDSGPTAPHPVRTTGTGLMTLGERYRALGGELGFVRRDGGQLTGWLPIENGDRT